MPRDIHPVPDARQLAAVHALAFLVLGNAVAVLLATLLLWPPFGAAIGALGYGRWVSLHLDLHLYGWGSLPLVAMLLAFLAADVHAPRLARAAVHAWSAMLVVGCASWLAARGSGKPFLEWSGGARAFLVIAMSLLWLALLVAFTRSLHGAPRPSRARKAGREALLVALLPVPLLLAWAASPSVYPAINPDSGGPTGVSLMGSVLGIVALFVITPSMLGLERRAGRVAPLVLTCLVIHGLVFAVLDHGNHSHHEPVQVFAMLGKVDDRIGSRLGNRNQASQLIHGGSGRFTKDDPNKTKR